MTIAEAQAAFPEPLMIPGRFRVRVIRGCGIRDGPRLVAVPRRHEFSLIWGLQSAGI